MTISQSKRAVPCGTDNERIDDHEHTDIVPKPFMCYARVGWDKAARGAKGTPGPTIRHSRKMQRDERISTHVNASKRLYEEKGFAGNQSRLYRSVPNSIVSNGFGRNKRNAISVHVVSLDHWIWSCAFVYK